MVIFRTIFFELLLSSLKHSFTSISSINDLGITPRDKTNEYIAGVKRALWYKRQNVLQYVYSGGDSSRTTPWSGLPWDPLSSSSIRSGTSMVETTPVSSSSTTSSRVAIP